jgi:hypothetical protein
MKWELIPVEKCQRLIVNMTRGVEAVLSAKEGYTNYDFLLHIKSEIVVAMVLLF